MIYILSISLLSVGMPSVSTRSYYLLEGLNLTQSEISFFISVILFSIEESCLSESTLKLNSSIENSEAGHSCTFSESESCLSYSLKVTTNSVNSLAMPWYDFDAVRL